MGAAAAGEGAGAAVAEEGKAAAVAEDSAAADPAASESETQTAEVNHLSVVSLAPERQQAQTGRGREGGSKAAGPLRCWPLTSRLVTGPGSPAASTRAAPSRAPGVDVRKPTNVSQGIEPAGARAPKGKYTAAEARLLPADTDPMRT